MQVSAKGLLLGSGYPMMAADQLQKFRAAINDDVTGEVFVRLVEASQTGAVQILGGRYEPLKRNPKGYAVHHPRSELLRWKGVEVSQRIGSPKWLSTLRATSKIRGLMTNGAPAIGWLDEHVGPSALTSEEIWGR